MKNFLKQISLCMVVMICLSCVIPVYAHNRDVHDGDIEYVLFGDREYKNTHPLAAEKIQAIEDAAYLCIDQYNGSGKDTLENLKKEKISDIPDSIKVIDFKSNYTHRYYTHRGWNVTTNSDKAHWPRRQKILINTVDKELFSNSKSLISKVPVLSNIFANEEMKENRRKCESFSVLIYYVHILGDHDEAKEYSSLAAVDPLTNLNDRDNPGVIPDLVKYCGILFEDQEDTYTYKNFMQELEELENQSDKLTSSKGGINTDEKFESYHQYANDLLNVLGEYIPGMLKKEYFFKNMTGL